MSGIGSCCNRAFNLARSGFNSVLSTLENHPTLSLATIAGIVDGCFGRKHGSNAVLIINAAMLATSIYREGSLRRILAQPQVQEDLVAMGTVVANIQFGGNYSYIPAAMILLKSAPSMVRSVRAWIDKTFPKLMPELNYSEKRTPIHAPLFSSVGPLSNLGIGPLSALIGTYDYDPKMNIRELYYDMVHFGIDGKNREIARMRLEKIEKAERENQADSKDPSIQHLKEMCKEMRAVIERRDQNPTELTVLYDIKRFFHDFVQNNETVTREEFRNRFNQIFQAAQRATSRREEVSNWLRTLGLLNQTPGFLSQDFESFNQEPLPTTLNLHVYALLQDLLKNGVKDRARALRRYDQLRGAYEACLHENNLKHVTEDLRRIHNILHPNAFQDPFEEDGRIQPPLPAVSFESFMSVFHNGP